MDHVVQNHLIVDAELAGQRLDKALGALLPELGLRARRRLWDAKSSESGVRVLVNGRPHPPGLTVIVGDVIELRAAESGAPAPALAPAQEQDCWAGNDVPRFLEARDGLLFFYKPAGLHSVALAGGRGGPNLEERLPSLLPPALLASKVFSLGADAPLLLNRLDYGTSGLMVAGSDADAVQRWRTAEDAGLCQKTYVALLTGALTTELRVTQALDTAQRRVSRVLPAEAPPLRHTGIEPLCVVRADDLAGLVPWASSLASCAPEVALDCVADQPLTLALCHIRKGARHQIRAHAAHAGYPLWGDARYDGSGAGGEGCFVLHHARLDVYSEAVTTPCPWLALLPEKIANDITQSLEKNKFLW